MTRPIKLLLNSLAVLGLTLFVAGSPRFGDFLALAGPPAFPEDWDAGYEADPLGTDPINVGDNHIRAMKSEIRNRAETEHEWGAGLGGAATDTGRQSMGSARIYVQAAEPGGAGTEIGPPTADTAGSQSVDLGRIWKDSDNADGVLRYTDTVGGDYARPLVTVLEGDPDQSDRIKVTTNGGANITTFCEDDFATECMDLHNHTGRHTDQTSAAGSHDYVSGTVRTTDLAPTISPSNDGTACAGAPCDGDGFLDSGEYATQATITVDTTGRRGVSRVMILAQFAYEVNNNSTVYCWIATSAVPDTPLNNKSAMSAPSSPGRCVTCETWAVLENVPAGGVQTYVLRASEHDSADAAGRATNGNCDGGAADVPITDINLVDFGVLN